MTSPWSAPEFEQIAAWVESRVGLCFAPNRCESLEFAVRQMLEESSGAGVREFAERLVNDGRQAEELLAQLTVGETYFFRDYAQFELLERLILPELARRRGADYRPRVWSAGCSTGEEAYSLAISLARCEKLDGAFVLGTDLNEASLARARKGKYKKWALRGVPPEILERYFETNADAAVLSPLFTRRVQFERLNLAGASYPSPVTSTFAMDVIFCRNVLIYFGPSAIARVARGFFDTLSPGGVLFTGPSDPPLRDFGFEIEHVAAGTVYRRPLTVPLARPPTRISTLPPRPRVEPARPLARTAAPEKPAPEELRARAERAYAERDANTLAQLYQLHPEAWLCALLIRTKSRSEPPAAVELMCRAALRTHRLDAELYYLHALVLIELSRRAAAVEALRRALYLEPSLAIAHFTLGSVLAGESDARGAERAYRNAVRSLSGRPEDEPVPCARELNARALSAAAESALERLRTWSIAR